MKELCKNLYTCHLGFDWCTPEELSIIENKLIIGHLFRKKYYNTRQYSYPNIFVNSRIEHLIKIIKTKIFECFPKVILENEEPNKFFYISNLDWGKCVLHHHLNIPNHLRSVVCDLSKYEKGITTVFYLKKQIINQYDGAFAYLLNDRCYIHQGIAGDLLVLPSNAYHAPLLTKSKEYRISLNINFKTVNNINDFT